MVMANDSRDKNARLNGHRLIHHATFGFVVTHLDMPNQGKIFTEGMPDKPVVGQNAT